MAGTVSRLYGDFRGVDLRGEECNLQRSPDSLNMWRDYRKETGICTRPKMEQVLTGEMIDNAFHLSEQNPGAILIYHVRHISFYHNKMMLQIDVNVMGAGNLTGLIASYDLETKQLAGLGEIEPYNNGQSFVYNDVWYFKQKGCYKRFDEQSGLKDVEGYIPTTSTGRTPAGEGEAHEDANMLSEQRINEFIGDGESTAYYLDAQNIRAVAAVWVNDAQKDIDQVNNEMGVVKFATAPEKDAKVKIQFFPKYYEKVNPEAQKIYNCSLVQVFDNRVFFSGNPDYPNMMWHSAVDDPTYVSDLDYYQDGQDGAAIRALVAGNDALWVFREPSDENTTVFYHRPALDENYGRIYPAVHSSIATGCVGGGINFNDDIVFFSDRGMEGVRADITAEQALYHRSSLVDREMTASFGYRDMTLVEWEGYLLAFVGNKVFLADSRGKWTNGDHMEYEWFRWEMKELRGVYCAAAHDGILYVGTSGGVYSMTDYEGAIGSYWTTPKDKFKNPNRLKTTNKRGCVVEATGDVAVYAKTEGTEFEQIADEKGVTDYFVPRIKQKKFKDIQLKFQSDTGFSLDSVTLECFIGGYIKR